jgi:hypothetical protein
MARRRRRHSNTDGRRQIQRGRLKEDADRMERRLLTEGLERITIHVDVHPETALTARSCRATLAGTHYEGHGRTVVAAIDDLFQWAVLDVYERMSKTAKADDAVGRR